MIKNVSIITSTLNCLQELKQTYKSLLDQKDVTIQWIIADGLSNDGTKEFLEYFDNEANISVDCFSQKDTGIYDAWNNACKLIKYEWTIFLGAGDTFLNNKTLSSALNKIPKNLTNVLVYGNVVQKRFSGKDIYSAKIIQKDWVNFTPSIPFHQGVFHHINLLNINNPFDASYKIVGDSKFMLNYKNNGKDFIYIDIDITHMIEGGISANPKNSHMVMKELFRLERDIGYKLPIFLKIKLLARTIYKKLLSCF